MESQDPRRPIDEMDSLLESLAALDDDEPQTPEEALAALVDDGLLATTGSTGAGTPCSS